MLTLCWRKKKKSEISKTNTDAKCEGFSKKNRFSYKMPTEVCLPHHPVLLLASLNTHANHCRTVASLLFSCYNKKLRVHLWGQHPPPSPPWPFTHHPAQMTIISSVCDGGVWSWPLNQAQGGPVGNSRHSPHTAGMQIGLVVRYLTPWTRDSPELIKQSLHIRMPGSSPRGRDASQGHSSRSRDSLPQIRMTNSQLLKLQFWKTDRLIC